MNFLRQAAVTTQRSNLLKVPSSLTRRTLSSAVTKATESSGPPSVMDSVVQLTVVDPSGARRQIPGYIGEPINMFVLHKCSFQKGLKLIHFLSFCLGKSLYETCELNGIELGPASWGHPPESVRSDTWTEPLYGEGPGTGFDHVLLVGNGSDQVDPMTWKEERALTDYWDDDEIFPESRLATQVVVKKEMDGMVVYVPDRICDDIP